MEALECIMTRRSVRKYTHQPIDRETIHKLVEAALYAPSAMNRQPWRFVVIDDRSILDAVQDFHPSAKMLVESPAAILVCGKDDPERQPHYWYIDCAAATQNILLAAHALGLSSCWLGITPQQERVEGMLKLIPLPEGIHPFALIALGYPADAPTQPERWDESRIHNNQW